MRDTAMYRRLGILVVLAVAACAPRPPRPVAPGMIAGIIRDATVGSAVENVIIVVRRPGEIAPLRHVTDGNGTYMIPELPPGRYDVVAYVQQLVIGERTADVRPGEVTGLDFTVAGLDADAAPDLNAPGAPTLWRYRPRGADPGTAVIEGTVADLRAVRIPGAVVSVTSTGTITTAQTVTDDEGRYSVPDLPPGSYDVSAYYSVVRRGQMEVRRSHVTVVGGEVVVVPLWIDTDGQ